jgi:hypothetical protein
VPSGGGIELLMLIGVSFDPPSPRIAAGADEGRGRGDVAPRSRCRSTENCCNRGAVRLIDERDVAVQVRERTLRVARRLGHAVRERVGQLRAGAASTIVFWGEADLSEAAGRRASWVANGAQ